MLWQKYFKLVKLVPGKVIVQGIGTVDFSGDVPVELCQQLWENDFAYLEITEEGKRELYGVESLKFKPDSNRVQSAPDHQAGLKLEELETVNPEHGTKNEQPEKPKRKYKRKV